jgi:hypothetical protein
MTVAVPISHRYTLSVVDGVKQLNRRRLPTRARLASNRKQDRATKNNSSYIDEHAMIAIVLTTGRTYNYTTTCYC